MDAADDPNELDVVVPVYNAGPRLKPAVRRLAQLASNEDVRVYLVDDGSTDETRDILGSLDLPGIECRRQPNRGPAAARNTGASMGKGRWIGFLDIDDEPDHDWASRLLSLTDEAGIVGCGGRFVRGDESVVRAPTPLGPASAGASVVFLPGLFIVSRDVFESAGGYDEEFRFSENTELGMRIAEEARRRGRRIASTEECLISVHLPSSGRSNAYSSDVRLASARLMLAKHGERLRADPRHLASYEAIAGVESLRTARRVDARRHLWNAVRLRPLVVRYWLNLLRSLGPRRWSGGDP